MEASPGPGEVIHGGITRAGCGPGRPAAGKLRRRVATLLYRAPAAALSPLALPFAASPQHRQSITPINGTCVLQ